MTDLHQIRFEDLRIFRHVASTGSITAAAAQLGYVQSAVSRQIAALERRCGGPLFTRLTRGVRLTPAGRALLRHAEHLIDAAGRAADEVADVRAGNAGTVTVGAFATASAALVPAAIRRLAGSRPDVKIRFTEALTARLLDRVRTGDMQIAVVSDYPAGIGHDDEIELTRLVDDRLLVAMDAHHPAALRHRLRLRDLADEHWVVGGGYGDRHWLHEACAGAGFVPRLGFEVAGWTAKLGFVAAGLGITLVPAVAATAVRSDVVLRRLADAVPARTVFVARPRLRDDRAADHVAEALAEEAQALNEDVAALVADGIR